jgi:hypothetical protein
MNITLVSIHPQPSPQAVPLACAFLKETLRADPALAASVEVELRDFFLADSAAACAEAILSTAPDLVGFSIYVWCREKAMAVAAELKARAPQLAICAGGAEATANPAPLLAAATFDFLILGEGEGPFLEVARRAVRGEGAAGVSGVLFPGAAIPPLPAPVHIDSIPSPYLSGTLDPAATGGALWQISRGCDFACAFCFDHKGNGGVRRFKTDRIEQELRLFARLGVPQVFVLDSTFNKIPQRAKEILRLIRKLAPEVHFHFEVRSEYLDAEMADLFASITCSLQIGLQSADPAVLRAVGRGFDPDDFAYRVSLLNASGAIFGFDLIYGLPGDTLALFRSSVDFALSLYPNHLDIFPLALLPGTRLHRKAGALELRHLDAPPYTVLSTPTFPPDDLDRARRLAAACDVFYSRGKAVAWFNAVADAVKLAPSALLESFSNFLGSRGNSEEEIGEDEIPELQRNFLKELFGNRKKLRLLPLALDLVEYHHQYACALLTAPPRVPNAKELKKIDPLRAPLKLSPSTRLSTFNYEILEILEAGDLELPAFASCYDPSDSFAIIYPADGEIRTESVSVEYYRLLQELDGNVPASEICRRLSIPAAQAREFLLFALSEGIITLP